MKAGDVFPLQKPLIHQINETEATVLHSSQCIRHFALRWTPTSSLSPDAKKGAAFVKRESTPCKHPPQTHHFPVTLSLRRCFLPAASVTIITRRFSGALCLSRSHTPVSDLTLRECFPALDGFYVKSSAMKSSANTGLQVVKVFPPPALSLSARAAEVSMRGMSQLWSIILTVYSRLTWARKNFFFFNMLFMFLVWWVTRLSWFHFFTF